MVGPCRQQKRNPQGAGPLSSALNLGSKAFNIGSKLVGSALGKKSLPKKIFNKHLPLIMLELKKTN